MKKKSFKAFKREMHDFLEKTLESKNGGFIILADREKSMTAFRDMCSHVVIDTVRDIVVENFENGSFTDSPFHEENHIEVEEKKKEEKLVN